MMPRLLSHSETTSLLTCEAQHAFRYTGVLTGGDALRPRDTAPILREGRAWGAGVAAWHATGDPETARRKLLDQVDEDAAAQQKQGLYLPDEHDAMRDRLGGVLAHYIATSDRLVLTDLEREFVVPIPSRTGRRGSSRYRIQCYVDGLHRDEKGRAWPTEFKFRGTLQSLEQISLSRQTRWYAWAYWQETGEMPAGVIVDERWNELPKPARLVKAKRKSDPQDADGKTPSHAVDQLCTAESYLTLCAEYGVEPNPETEAAMRARRWQMRHVVPLRPLEIVEVGRQLVSVAQQTQDLESGRLWPVRNPDPRRCPGCAFKEICADPSDGDLIDVLFERVSPKRDRVAVEVAA